MPGLNQLKKFSEDIKNVGDETKIRAQRGEKTVSIPIPAGISEKDDSEDFLTGMPEIKNSEAEKSNPLKNQNDENENSAPDLNSILTPQGDIGGDEPDLSDFLDDLNLDNENSLENEAQNQENLKNENEEQTAQSENEKNDETPLEDLDLDDLLNSVSDENLSENQNSENENQETENQLENVETENPENAAEKIESAEEFEETEKSENLMPADFENLEDFDFDSPAQDSAKDEAAQSAQTEGEKNEAGSSFASDELQKEPENNLDADFNFEGQPINLNDDFSENEAENSAEENSLEKNETDSSLNENIFSGNDSENGGSKNDDFANLPEMNGDLSMFDTSGLDNIDFDSPEENLSENFGKNPENEIADAAFDIPSDSFSAENQENQKSSGLENSQKPSGDEQINLDVFDTSEMENVDFTPETQKSSGISENDFPVTGENMQDQNDDFVLDDSFTIPGFSDTETADLSKKPQVDTVDFSGKSLRPKNTLTEAEYEKFKKNLFDYPLNLRLAIEDFIAKNEFTDDVVFEIIEKVLKKAPARQIAGQLEKLLDISINVPRDYEKRSYEQYEAYKQSFQYTLKNRIIPAAVVGLVLCFVCFGLFRASQKFIYEPVMAGINYKQGFALLENNEFPQSEDKFNEAVSHKAVKKWFFKFADGYRDKKQFERASNIYRKALSIFNHDLQAGIEYAEMELYDRANYARAEEIVRREILDYHINDPSGLLLLGDVFLEWAQTDETKYELAKNQYIELLQRYGDGNLIYLSRMLRYYIRTDELREVLNLKNTFYYEKNRKALGADDWTELSGYMLDKLYGKLDKNDEFLRTSIEDVRSMLEIAVSANQKNPVAHYNLARYFIHNSYNEQAKSELETALKFFEAANVRTKKDIYRQINASRILGELYAGNREYLKAQEIYTNGANLYNSEHDLTGFEGDENTGKLFADLGDIDYFISGELDSALFNYKKSAEIKNDTPSVNYRIGAIYYEKEDYGNALASFLKVQEKEPKDANALLALGNTLVLRGDNFAAQSYYETLLSKLDLEKSKRKILLPQEDEDEGIIVDLYLRASNNLGVALYKTAQQTGSSQQNANAMVHFSDSMKAWDALTRNPRTMVRMEGGNLAQQNSTYITHSFPDYEPAIYIEIQRVLSDEKELE